MDLIKNIKTIDLSDKNYKQIISLYSEFGDIDPRVITIDKLKNIVTNLNDNHYILFYICKNKIIAGITVLIEQKIIHNGKCVGHIEDLVVLKNYRNCGIGRVLINHAIDLCNRNNCYKCILNCDQALDAYYVKQGFIKNP